MFYMQLIVFTLKVFSCSTYKLILNGCNLCNFSFRRLYKKNGRRYSVYALKSEKTYGYISELQRRIVKNRLTSGVGMPRRRSLLPDDPRQLGLVPPVPAPATSDLLQRQIRRGLGKLHKFVAYVVPYYMSLNDIYITI